MYPYYYYLPSYSTLLELHYGNHIWRSQVAQGRARETGISIQESERQVDLELFLDEYPWWGLGTPHQSVVLHKMFLHAMEWGWKEAECMFCWGHWDSVYEADPGADQSAMELVGYCSSWKELRDIYHNIYLLKRSPGFPSCGEQQRRRTIQDILPSLMDWLHRWAYPTTTRDLDPQGGELVRLDQWGSYEAALQVACQRALETAETLQSDLKRLGKELRERSQAHSHSWSRSWSRTHSRSQSRTRSRGQSRNHARANSQSLSHGDLWGMHPQSPDKPLPRRKVTFNDPEDEKGPAGEGAGYSTEPSVGDVETWFEFQAQQLGTPTWWEELGAIPGIKDLWKFAQKIRASFYILEVWMRVSLEQGYTVPLAPWSLNRSTFLPEKLMYQDVWQQPALLTIAYAWSLQYWVEKCNPLRNLDFCPLVESVRELWQTVWEFVTISHWDIMQGLEVESPETTHPQLKTTIFSWVLSTPVDEQETAEVPSHSISPLAEEEVIWCTSMLPKVEQSDRYMLVVTSSVGWLSLGPDGNNTRGSPGGGNVFWNLQMSAVFPPPCGAISYGGATMKELNE